MLNSVTISKKTLQRIAAILCLIRDSDIVVLYFRFALETMATNRPSVALLRVTKGFAFDFLFNLCTYSVHLDLSELGTLPSICQVTYPNKDDLLHFTLTISPDDVKTLTTLRKNNEWFWNFRRVITKVADLVFHLRLNLIIHIQLPRWNANRKSTIQILTLMEMFVWIFFGRKSGFCRKQSNFSCLVRTGDQF